MWCVFTDVNLLGLKHDCWETDRHLMCWDSNLIAFRRQMSLNVGTRVQGDVPHVVDGNLGTQYGTARLLMQRGSQDRVPRSAGVFLS